MAKQFRFCRLRVQGNWNATHSTIDHYYRAQSATQLPTFTCKHFNHFRSDSAELSSKKKQSSPTTGCHYFHGSECGVSNRPNCSNFNELKYKRDSFEVYFFRPYFASLPLLAFQLYYWWEWWRCKRFEQLRYAITILIHKTAHPLIWICSWI